MNIDPQHQTGGESPADPTVPQPAASEEAASTAPETTAAETPAAQTTDQPTGQLATEQPAQPAQWAAPTAPPLPPSAPAAPQPAPAAGAPNQQNLHEQHQKTRPRTGPIVWGCLILAFCAYIAVSTVSPGTVDTTNWIIATVLCLGVLLLAIGTAVVVRGARNRR